MDLPPLPGREWPLLDRPGTVLVDDRPGGRGGATYLLADPRETIVAEALADVPAALERLEAAVQSGFFAAGYIAYDAGFALDMPTRSRHAPAMPLVWLGVYDRCHEFAADALEPSGSPPTLPQLSGLQFNLPAAAYRAAVARAKEYIAAGDVYQVNYTCKLRFAHEAPASQLFRALRQAHPVDHAAWIHGGPWQVASLSPELFLRRQGAQLLTRPMKGTLRRGHTAEEDAALAASLPRDEKNRAENVMIVDLMRNDLGRVCRFGSVQVRRALHVEPYPSLFQMTSDVVGQLRPDVGLPELLRAVFPPGSVSGAPKIRAVQIIDELELESRGVYCGAIGLFRPGGDCLLSVGIRTIVQRGANCEMGLGSGIVADSQPEAEFREVELKSRFLTAALAKGTGTVFGGNQP